MRRCKYCLKSGLHFVEAGGNRWYLVDSNNKRHICKAGQRNKYTGNYARRNRMYSNMKKEEQEELDAIENVN